MFLNYLKINRLKNDSVKASRRHNFKGRKRQQGSMLIVAIFIITVMVFIAVALQDVFDKAAKSVAYEVYGARALSAANSGAEVALQKIFNLGAQQALVYNNAIPQVATLTLNSNGFTSAMFNCSVEVTIEKFTVSDATYFYDFVHYRIESTATCVAGSYTTVRTIAVEGRET